jgi:hypothetical protein
MNTAIKRAQTLAGDALEQATQAAVARATASRQAAGAELTGADIDRVSGGLVLPPVIRAGGFPVDPRLISGPATNPVLPAVQNIGMVM